MALARLLVLLGLAPAVRLLATDGFEELRALARAVLRMDEAWDGESQKSAASWRARSKKAEAMSV